MASAAGAIRFALSQIGKPYLWGATGPDSYDCSGLLQTAYSKGSGIDIPRTTWDMLADDSLTPVNQGQLQPGDLVFPSTEHVQMYLGGGKVIEAPHSGANVRIVNLGNFYAGRRVTNPASGDWSGVSPVSDTSPIDNTSGSRIWTASDVSEGVGTGLTNVFSDIFKVVGSWSFWMFEVFTGTITILAGLYFIGGRNILKGMSS